jgi:hypothetical protein
MWSDAQRSIARAEGEAQRLRHEAIRLAGDDLGSPVHELAADLGLLAGLVADARAAARHADETFDTDDGVTELEDELEETKAELRAAEALLASADAIIGRLTTERYVDRQLRELAAAWVKGRKA